MNDGLVEELDAAANRPVIKVKAGSLPAVVEQAEEALAAAGTIYQRGPLLARIARLTEPSRAHGINRAAGSLVIIALDVDYARLALGDAADWFRWDVRANGWLPSDPPAAVARTLLSAAGHWSHVAPLAGIVETPTLRADGSLLDQPGYDMASGLYYDPNGVSYRPIPAAPTRQEAFAALELIAEILGGFPFSDGPARSVAVSAILTALVRRVLRSAPLFVFTAPKMGSGKTLLATVVAYIATGRPPPMMSQAEDPESERKRMLALLLEGPMMVVIDNIERPLRSDALCSILTEPVFADRLLGASKTVAVPTNCTWVATGNNISVAGDLSTRVLVCELDPECERPEEREFAVDLHHVGPERRGELAIAGLTIIRAYLAAGSPPQQVPTFGRFEAWAKWCRDPLLWLGLADPCATRRKAEARDPVRELLVALLQAWHALFGGTPTTVAEAIRTADTTTLQPAEVELNQALQRAMTDVAGERGVINARRLGRFFGRHERRVEGGLRFQQGEMRHGVATWRVVTVAGSAGSAGLPPTPTRESQAKNNNQQDANPRNRSNPPDGPAPCQSSDGAVPSGGWRTIF
jgi:putative DNA primase/helicase